MREIVRGGNTIPVTKMPSGLGPVFDARGAVQNAVGVASQSARGDSTRRRIGAAGPISESRGSERRALRSGSYDPLARW